MIPLFDRGHARAAIIIGLTALLQGCYYIQAARGQLEVMRKREPIADVIDATETPPALAERLRLVDQARQFSIDELGLPDNDSYRSYADIERDYVVWNVFAAPEFSLEPKNWCFPIAGCVGYRGYFSEQAASKEGASLKEQGFDVVVSGIPAYSTLGRFSDPVLNTMMHWNDTELIVMIFHELAHQVLYIKGDTGFNESFATAVEEVGIERWLAARDLKSEIGAYQERRNLRRHLIEIVTAARTDLTIIYSEEIDDVAMRTLKEQRLDALSREVAGEFKQAGRDASSWLSSGLNNARLASMALYDGRLPAFRVMLDRCNDELACFYDEARRLSKLGVDEGVVEPQH